MKNMPEIGKAKYCIGWMNFFGGLPQLRDCTHKQAHRAVIQAVNRHAAIAIPRRVYNRLDYADSCDDKVN